MKSRFDLYGRTAVRGVVLILSLSFLASIAEAAVKARTYPMGEEDADGEPGQTVTQTEDTTSALDDGQGEFVPLIASGAPLYTEGREDDAGQEGVAIAFDGVDDTLTAGAFDPRNFGGSFAALSQAWVKPDMAGSGTQQAIWSLGNDNGGAGISADGHWELIAVSGVPDITSDVAVEFDVWTHLAVLRTGNTARLYINGSLETSGDNFWNGVGTLTVGNRASGGGFFVGAIDDFAISGFQDGAFDSVVDIDFFGGEPNNVFGDLNQDGVVDAADYTIWSSNSGFDNELGAGDGATLLMGDVDQNGRINFFDYWLIQNEVNEAPPAALGADGLVVADDFLYNQPNKVIGPGGGFTLQDYGGGAGTWQGRWVSIGNAIITNSEFEPPEQRFAGLTTTGLSASSLDRNVDLSAIPADEPIYFAVSFMIPDGGSPLGKLVLNSPDDEVAEISIGIDPGLGFTAKLGTLVEFPLELVEISTGVFHRLVGKLEINADAEAELLSVWLDPEGEEEADFEVFAEADVVSDVEALAGDLRLDRGTAGGGAMIWDDVAVGTTWAAVAGVAIERVELVVNQASGSVSLVNNTGADIDLKYYSLSSESGSLVPASWTALADQAGSPWMRNNESANQLTESRFMGTMTFANGASLDLGPVFATDGTQDFVARLGTEGGLLNVAIGDRDEDGVPDPSDNCVVAANADQADADGDGLGDVCDNCPEVSNREQTDLDADGIGNLCDDEIADTFRDWSLTGTQGENNMYYGYFDVSDDLSLGGTGEYEADKFTEFLNDGSEFVSNDALNWREGLNHWTGVSWDLTTGGAAPWTALGRVSGHPNDADPESEHHPIRRWVVDRDASVTVVWHLHHENVACGGNGVGGQLYHNDELVDEASVAGPDDVGVTRSVELSIQEGDTIDLLLNPTGPDGVNDDGCDGSENWFLVRSSEGSGFNRGDSAADGDPTPVGLNDGVFTLNYLFTGGPTPTCMDAADANDDGEVEITDAIFTLNFLFLGGTAPPAPDAFNPCGPDPTDDDLGCESYDNCN